MASSFPIAVLGAGNVGSALAADLALRGFEVRLFNRSANRLDAIRRAGGIRVTGVIEGVAPLARITDSLREAVAGAGVVAVAVPTASLPAYAPLLAEATEHRQLLWLDPGHSGGALYLAAELERRTGRRSRRLCQLTTASHISRVTEPGSVHVFLRASASVAAFPAGALDECREQLEELLPGQFDASATVLEADLANINAILHPPGMLCNAGWIEATAGGFGFYADGATPAVVRMIEAIDRERLALAERLEISAVPFVELFHRLGFTPGPRPRSSVADALRSSDLIHPIRAPAMLNHRYLHEDVGWGLAQWAHLAGAAGCPVPAIGALTCLAGVLAGVDYTREGVTLEKMGLDGKSAARIRAYLGAPEAASTRDGSRCGDLDRDPAARLRARAPRASGAGGAARRDRGGALQ